MSAFEAAGSDNRLEAPPLHFAVQTAVNSQITAFAGREILSCAEIVLAEVVARTGFASPAHMSTAFAREVGLSPARHRWAFRPDSSEARSSLQKDRR
jgi:AraC-like DNA-binding protein